MERGVWPIFASIILAMCIGVNVYMFSIEDETQTMIPETYNVKVDDWDYHFLGKSAVFIEQDGKKLECKMPTREQLENKTPMDCTVLPESVKVG